MRHAGAHCARFGSLPAVSVFLSLLFFCPRQSCPHLQYKSPTTPYYNQTPWSNTKKKLSTLSNTLIKSPKTALTAGKRPAATPGRARSWYPTTAALSVARTNPKLCARFADQHG